VDGQGTVGFIASVSEPFCGVCRARVSADGQLYTCLFATGADSNRGSAKRCPASTAEDAIHARWNARDDRYSELNADRRRAGTGKSWPTVRMLLVGG
jgi:cyclic pyranopterin phosphate synthase